MLQPGGLRSHRAALSPQPQTVTQTWRPDRHRAGGWGGDRWSGAWGAGGALSGWLAEGEPLTSDRSAFCKGSRESKVNDRRQLWGAGGPQGG